jgi:PadR family transcriptional regulator, regulatory protein PadR
MNIENTKAQMRKGVLEFCILSVYPLLTRLKNDGLLNYRWEESTSGPPRKYYGLTEIGKTFLTELNGTWTELSDAVTIITNKN